MIAEYISTIAFRAWRTSVAVGRDIMPFDDRPAYLASLDLDDAHAAGACSDRLG